MTRTMADQDSERADRTRVMEALRLALGIAPEDMPAPVVAPEPPPAPVKPRLPKWKMDKIMANLELARQAKEAKKERAEKIAELRLKNLKKARRKQRWLRQ